VAAPVLTGATIGVIGAGIFGVTAALELDALGADVTLYEEQGGILAGTTANNYFRLHRGYHYPRDPETARQARDGYESFTAMFAGALTRQVPHYYAIAAHGSLTTAEQFAGHCDRLGLRATPRHESMFVPGMIEQYFEADESYYDPWLLRQICGQRLARSRVQVRLNASHAADHDVLVVAAYASLNRVLSGLGCPVRELQYEACEVAVIRAPTLMRRSVVVMDGPFMSFTPYGRGLHLLYDVEHSVHGARRTKFPEMLSKLQRFTGVLPGAHLVDSLWAGRVVLPGVDASDARPTQVTRAAPNVLSVLSGKVCTSVDTARLVAAEVTEMLAGRCDEPAGVRDHAHMAAQPVAAR
jgi:hypothetical protein